MQSCVHVYMVNIYKHMSIHADMYVCRYVLMCYVCIHIYVHTYAHVCDSQPLCRPCVSSKSVDYCTAVVTICTPPS